MKVGNVFERSDGAIVLVLKTFRAKGIERFVCTSLSKEPFQVKGLFTVIPCLKLAYYHVPAIGFPTKEMLASLILIDDVKDISTIEAILHNPAFANSLAMALQTL